MISAISQPTLTIIFKNLTHVFGVPFHTESTVSQILQLLTARNLMNIGLVCGSSTRNGIRWQFSGGEHDVAEVQSSVVDAAELLVWVVSFAEVLERRLDPVKA